MKALYRFDDHLRSLHSSSAQTPFTLIGIDEAGRGPLAGPVVACALILPENFNDSRLNDSKKMTHSARESLYPKLKKESLWAFGLGQVDLIDSVNILQATHKAMHMALQNLLRLRPGIIPGLVAIDGRPIPPTGHKQVSIVRGDGKSASIAAASVMAKVFRDRIMKTVSRHFPEYSFHQHKGYGTRLHQQELARLGPTPIHRKTFFPVSEFFASQN